MVCLLSLRRLIIIIIDDNDNAFYLCVFYRQKSQTSAETCWGGDIGQNVTYYVQASCAGQTSRVHSKKEGFSLTFQELFVFFATIAVGVAYPKKSEIHLMKELISGYCVSRNKNSSSFLD